jgi:hypothetical protein
MDGQENDMIRSYNTVNKGVMRILKPKVIQHSGQRKKNKRPNNNLQCITEWFICFACFLRNICDTNDHWYIPLVVSTSRNFPPSWFITGHSTNISYNLLLPWKITAESIDKTDNRKNSYLKCQLLSISKSDSWSTILRYWWVEYLWDN